MSVQKATTVMPVRVRSRAETYDEDFLAVRERLVGICRSLVGDDAEDVVQDVYLLGRSRLAQLRRPELLGAWLTRIAINACFQRHRRRQRLAELLPRLSTPQVQDRDVDLRMLIEKMPFRERCILVLHYGHGLTLDEIAEILSLNGATTRSLLFRSRAQLRKGLTDEG